MTTKIDPDRDALIFAGDVDVGGLSSNLPEAGGGAQSRTYPPSPRAQLQGSLSAGQSQRQRRGTESPSFQLDHGDAATDLDERFNWQAADTRTRLDSQVGGEEPRM